MNKIKFNTMFAFIFACSLLFAADLCCNGIGDQVRSVLDVEQGLHYSLSANEVKNNCIKICCHVDNSNNSTQQDNSMQQIINSINSDHGYGRIEMQFGNLFGCYKNIPLTLIMKNKIEDACFCYDEGIDVVYSNTMETLITNRNGTSRATVFARRGSSVRVDAFVLENSSDSQNYKFLFSVYCNKFMNDDDKSKHQTTDSDETDTGSTFIMENKANVLNAIVTLSNHHHCCDIYKILVSDKSNKYINNLDVNILNDVLYKKWASSSYYPDIDCIVDKITGIMIMDKESEKYWKDRNKSKLRKACDKCVKQVKNACKKCADYIMVRGSSVVNITANTPII